jgi:hypothetical protein
LPFSRIAVTAAVVCGGAGGASPLAVERALVSARRDAESALAAGRSSWQRRPMKDGPEGQ